MAAWLEGVMSGSQELQYTILAPGFAKWWGSDGRALAQAFRRLGHNLIEIDEEDYLPWRWDGVIPKASRRLLSPLWIKNYNETVLRHAYHSFYDFVLVFKGNLLKPETLRSLIDFGKPIFNFYPDTNFMDYGPNIPEALHLYDCVFTSKSFHGEREIQKYRIKNLRHVRHGFDPEVHRPIPLSNRLLAHYGCDVGFVGYWSPEYEARILYILKTRPTLKVRVYGLGWDHASRDFKMRLGDGLRIGVFGDELAIVYRASKVNLGLLRRATIERNISDRITARSFQIPATRSFMLHEDNAEVREFFRDGKEMLAFESNEDLISKIDLVLETPSLREAISQGGYERSLREPYDYSHTARSILRYFEEALNENHSRPDGADGRRGVRVTGARNK